MKNTFVFFAFISTALAFPNLSGRNIYDVLRNTRNERTSETFVKRQGLVPGVSSLVNDIEGLLGSVASAVDPDNYRPEPGYDYQEPGPNDSRGPCPGLNLLANHGYLPRDGYVNFGQVVNATACVSASKYER